MHFDRVEWTGQIPTRAPPSPRCRRARWTGSNNRLLDLLPVLRADRAIATPILDALGDIGIIRMNQLHPPFDNPAIRRALLGAVDQRAFMTAVTGDDPAFQHTPCGYFCPGSPMASDDGVDVLTGPRDYDKVKAELARAGYAGEKVVLLVPADSVVQKPLGDVAADQLRRAGLNVEYAAMTFGNTLTRRGSKAPVSAGGWSAVVGNPQGMDWLNPVGHQALGGTGSYFGWFASDSIQAMRADWLAATDAAEQQRICRAIQRTAFAEVPFYPIGQYKQPTAFRTRITGVLSGTATFWNVRPA